VLVVSRKTGDVIFRWGGMTHLKDKETGELEVATTLDTLSGPHNAQEIPPGVPGEGHFTVYDNGLVARGPLLASRAVEIDPYTGNLVWQSTKLFDGRLPVPFGRKHFSDFLGSAQRLPNGNTLMCEGVNGRFFQLTKELEPVWEYVNPFDGDSRFQGAVFQIQCYAPDYCPQFKNLPPAAGRAIMPPAKQTISSGDFLAWLRVQETSKLAALAAVVIAAAIIFFVFGWKLRSRRALALAAKSPPSRTSRETAK